MRFRMPDRIEYWVDGNAYLPEKHQHKDVSVPLSVHQEHLLVSVSATDTAIEYIRLRWTFRSEEKPDEEAKVYGDAWERAGGQLEWRGIVPERCMPWFFLVSTGSDRKQVRAGRRHEAFGVMVRPNAMCLWQYDSAGITLWLDVRCGGEGVRLGGRVLTAAEILFAEYSDITAYEAGHRFCFEMCKDPILPDKPVYGANNWYYAYGNSSHRDIVNDATMLAKFCRENVNRPYMVIDDGWSPNPKNGPWHIGNERFPDMAGLAETIHGKNAMPGIWVRYIYDEGNVAGLPEKWHLERDRSQLDPSRKEVLSYIADTTNRFVSWGYRLIKFDCSTQDILGRRGYRIPYVIADDGWHFFDQSRTSAEIIKEFYKTIRDSAGERAVLLGCAAISHLCAGYVHINRTGADINGKDWDITRRMGVNTLGFRMMMDEAFFKVDADCVGITGQLPWQQVGQWMKALSVSGTPMFVSCRPGALDENQTLELQTAYRVNSVQTDKLIPLDWMENICPMRWLLNGEEMTFDWFSETIPVQFAGKSI